MSRQALQAILVGYPSVGKEIVLSPSSGNQFEIYEMEAINRSGGALNCGLGIKLANGNWKVGQIDASATPDYIDATDAIQGGVATEIYSTTNDDGFLVQCNKRFNIIGLSASQAETGSPVYVYEYFDGSAYQTLATVAVSGAYTAADHWIVFAAPTDWAAGTTTAVGGDSSMFSIMMTASTAPTQAVECDDMWLGQLHGFTDTLADNGKLSLAVPRSEPLVLDATEGVMPYFSTAAAGNMCRVLYKQRG